MIITAIVPSHRREGRFDIQADGRPLATVSLDTVERVMNVAPEARSRKTTGA